MNEEMKAKIALAEKEVARALCRNHLNKHISEPFILCFFTISCYFWFTDEISLTEVCVRTFYTIVAGFVFNFVVGYILSWFIMNYKS